MKSAYLAEPMLTGLERAGIDGGAWFSLLSSTLRHDIFRHARILRYQDRVQIAFRGTRSTHWMGCASGAVQVCSIAESGKQVTLDYLQPGTWFGELSMFEDEPVPHDAFAHGDTVLLAVPTANFQLLLSEHVELYRALVQLQARRVKGLLRSVEDLHSLSMPTRLAKLLIRLARRFAPMPGDEHSADQICIDLSQDQIAQLLGGSRQRVNQELKHLERHNAIRVEMRRITIVGNSALQRFASATPLRNGANA